MEQESYLQQEIVPAGATFGSLDFSVEVQKTSININKHQELWGSFSSESGAHETERIHIYKF